VTILIDHGARVSPTAEMLANGQDKNAFYLLHYAVDDGLFDIAKLLIEKGKIPLNTLDQSGWSPLHLAAGHNNLEMVTLLLGKGADVNIRVCENSFDLSFKK
jgi:ankyrin repeat protein